MRLTYFYLIHSSGSLLYRLKQAVDETPVQRPEGMRFVSHLLI